MDSFKSFFSRFSSAVKGFFSGTVAPVAKKVLSGTAALFRKPTNAIACGAGAAAIIAACVLVWFSVNVWSWVDNVTLLLPPDVYAASIAAASDSDALSGTDLPVSGSDAEVPSPTDVVSDGDVSSTDTAGESVSLKLRLKKDSTVADALREANVTLDQSLSVDTPLDTVLVPDMVISVYRLMRVTVTADGTPTELYTEAETVAAVLEECGITMNEHDRISVPTDSAVTNNLTIVINRVVIKDEIKAETIPFTTERRENASVKAGQKSVITAGVNGSKDVTYRNTYVDGILESSEKVGEVVTLEPVTEVIEIGTKRTTTTTRKTSARKYVVSKEAVYDCDGSGHGYYIITYSDGSVVYQDF